MMLNLGILVMTCLPMVRIIWRSMWTQATCSVLVRGRKGLRETETHLVIRELRHDTLQGGLPAQSRGDVADIFRDVGPAPAYW